ncbi:hypothetical protein PGQ11_007829 [Apiospora arundinis]|uniref:Uncharacterized protein n=1 Tax=Apiospora arundinis TaxID=335852 RepID=A0ABR2IXA3_9PEZI
MRLSIPILLAPIVGVLGLEVTPGDIVKFEFQVGTLKAVGSLEFESDYCPHTQSSPQQTTTTTESSLDAPATNANTGEAQSITGTVIQTVFVTITDSTPSPTTVLHSGSVRTASANWARSANGTTRTMGTIGPSVIKGGGGFGLVERLQSLGPSFGLDAAHGAIAVGIGAEALAAGREIAKMHGLVFDRT